MSSNIKENSNIIERNFKGYTNYYNYCRDCRQKNIEFQNKVIITISTALYGLIVSSLDKILLLLDTSFLKICFIILIVLNAFVILFIFGSIFFANKGFKLNMEKKAKLIYLYGKQVKNLSCYDKIAIIFRNLYLLLTCLEVIILAVIISNIVLKEYKMDDEKNNYVVSNESLVDDVEASLPFSKFEKLYPKTAIDINKTNELKQDDNHIDIKNEKE